MIIKNWWKILCVVLLLYTLSAGLLMEVPRLPILHETIRNLHFHVTMWFSMLILFVISLVSAISYLNKSEFKTDLLSVESARIGMLMGFLGLITGSLWAKYTWGAWWVNDAKLNGAAASMLVYAAYFLLRSSIDDQDKKARIAAVYNIFAFSLMLVLIMIFPRLTDSLHPGNGGNPGFSSYDLDNNLRLVFYPAIVAWTLLGLWIMNIRIRLVKLEEKA